jgi:hypothetical protein
VPFDYYESLSPRQQAIYRKSDASTEVKLAMTRGLRAAVRGLDTALGTEKTREVQKAMTRLCGELTSGLGVAPVTVKVLAKRPSRRGEELHGLYEREEGTVPQITVWMRTAAHKKVVTFRTFLRTFLHELCHHLDYELLRLPDTFHTEGFFKRESSLMRTLAPPRDKKKKKPPRIKMPKPEPRKKEQAPEPDAGPVQLELPLFAK